MTWPSHQPHGAAASVNNASQANTIHNRSQHAHAGCGFLRISVKLSRRRAITLADACPTASAEPSML